MPSPDRSGPRLHRAGRVRPASRRRVSGQGNPAIRGGVPRTGHEIPDVIIEGEVLEADPPNRLVTTFRMLMDPGLALEPPTRITHEIKRVWLFWSDTRERVLMRAVLLPGRTVWH